MADERDIRSVKIYSDDHYELMLIKARLTKKTGETQTMADVVKVVVKYYTRWLSN